MFGPLPLIVAHPTVTVDAESGPSPDNGRKVRFLYPSFPRVHKNFETLCEAARILDGRGVSGFEVRLTLDGTENAYSRWLHRLYGQVKSISFIGLQERDAMQREYATASAIVFPGKLETWGLPITETKAHGKPLLASDLPYAHETVGDYAKVSFFPPQDAAILADLMQQIVEGRWRPSGSKETTPADPYARDWKALWTMLVADL